MTQEASTYLNAEIHIAARRGDHYQVHIRLSDGQDFAGELAADLAGWTSTGSPTIDGQHLFGALFADPQLRSAWDVASGQSSQRRIRLWLDTDEPELHVLPWELLHDGQTFLAADAATPFSRYLLSDTPWGSLVTGRPIRILAVISNPANLDQYNLAPLDVAAERALLTEALDDLAPAHFRLEILEAPVTPERLERALASGPHVLHFVGHGTFSEHQRQAVLYLQDEDGDVQLVTDIQLTNMLRRQKTPPSLIFLAACQSAERSTVDAFAGLAPKLVQAGVPAVVAMQDKVAIAATRKLTPVFYEELARHGEVDRALNAARSLLLTGQSTDVATPVLLMRLANGKLWEPLWAKTNPYRGLAAFTEADATFFFGRESLITELAAKAHRQRFIAVVGPSGSGKSSVVQAGLLSRLPKDWKIIKLRPGNDPYANEEWRTFNKNWQNDKLPFADSLIRRFVLFIDQFEELFALCSPDVQTHFLDDVQALVASPAPITVLLTLRADFFGHLQASPLGKHLEHALVNVLPMEPADLRAAIARPAQAVGLHFEAGLVETIMEDARQARHTLPLLQFALTQLWEHQEQGTLTYDAYIALGRVAGAIGLWAEDTYNGLTTEEQRLARRVFTRLLHYGEGDAADTRQRCTLSELLTQSDDRDALHRLLRRLADKRLITTDEAQGVEFVEIMHDALLKEWPRLEQWLTEQREFYLWRQRLETLLHTWHIQQTDDALLRGALLAEATRWQQAYPDGLNPDEHTFIQAAQEAEACRIADEEARRQRELRQAQTLAEEQQRRVEAQLRFTRRLRIALTVTVILLVIAVGGLLFANYQASRARNAETAAQQSATEAETRRQEAEVAQLEAEHLSRISRARELAARALAEDDPTGSLNLMLARESALTTWMTDSQVITYTTVTNETLDALYFAVYKAQHLPWRMTLMWRLRHTNLVNAVAYSPDGMHIASGSEDCTLRVWNAQTGIKILQLNHTEPVNAVAYSLDGMQIVSGSDDHIVRVWDAQSGDQLAQFIGHTGIVNAVAYSPDGTRIVSGGWDDTVRIWDAQNGVELLRLYYAGSVNAVAYSPDGTRIVSGGGDTMGVWDAQSGVELLQLAGHQSSVNAVAYSPDGACIVSGSEDNTVRVWDAQDGTELFQVIGHTGSVNAVAYSPDGARIVSGSEDNTVRVWDAQDGTQLLQLIGHTKSVNAVAYSADGTRIASASGGWIADWERLAGEVGDTSVRVWDAQSGTELLQLSQAKPINVVAYSPDGTQIASGSEDHLIQVWDVQNGTEITRFTGHSFPVNTLAYSPDGTHIVSTSEKGLLSDAIGDYVIRVWNIQDGSAPLQLIGHTDIVNAVAYSPDGMRIVSGSQDNTIRVWSAESGVELLRLNHIGSVNAVAFSPDGTRIVSGSRDALCIWDAWSGVKLRQLGHIGANRVVYSPDGTRIVSAYGDQTVRVWDAQSGDELFQLRHTDWVNAIAYSPDGMHIVSASGGVTTENNNRIWVWDAQSGVELAQFIGHTEQINAVAYSPDGTHIVSASGAWLDEDNTVRVWDAQNEAEFTQFSGHIKPVSAVTYSPDGTRIVSASQDYTLRVWDVWGKAELLKLTGHGVDVWAVAYSPDGTRIVSGSADNSMRIWDARNGTELLLIPAGPVRAVAYSPDGMHIVSASDDHMLHMWDAQSGTELAQFTGHTDIVNAVAYSPDGMRIISGSWDNTIRMWDAQSGTELTRFTVHTEGVNAVAYSPDGTRIVSGSQDNTVRVWDAESGVELFQLLGHVDSVNTVVYTSDGMYIVSGSEDRTVRIWDAQNGGEFRQLASYHFPVKAVACSPDGTRIVSASGDNTVRVWNITATSRARTDREQLAQCTGYDSWVYIAEYNPNGQHTIITNDSKDWYRMLKDTDYLLKLADCLIQRDPPIFTRDERTRFNFDEWTAREH